MMPCDDILSALVLGLPLPAGAEEHVEGCARCRVEAPLARQVAQALTLSSSPSPALGARVLTAAEPLLAARRRRVARRRNIDWWLVVRALGAALLPLPLILAIDVALVGVAWELLARVLPEALTTYLVANLAITLALLLALTYAAVPLLAARQRTASITAPAEEAHA
jgi:hypothetical protein